MGINNLNNTIENNSKETKQSWINSVVKKTINKILILGASVSMDQAIAQTTLPENQNKVLTQTEIVTDTIPSIDTILAKYNINLATIETNNDYNNLIKAREEIEKIGNDILTKKEEVPESYFNTFEIIEKRIAQIEHSKSAAELAQLKKETDEATKRAEQARKEREEVERVLGGNK